MDVGESGDANLTPPPPIDATLSFLLSSHTPHMPLSTPTHHQAITGVLFATLIFTAEGGRYDHTRKQYVREDGSASPFESIPASLWWTIVTMT